MKAQAHMYQKEYAFGKPLLDAIITSAKFTLVADYTWNFDMTHENNSESIFELQCTTTATATSSVAGSGCNFHQRGPAAAADGDFISHPRIFSRHSRSMLTIAILNVAARKSLLTIWVKEAVWILLQQPNLLTRVLTGSSHVAVLISSAGVSTREKNGYVSRQMAAPT